MRNYRSTPQIIDVANSVFAKNAAGVRLDAQSPSGVPVRFVAHPDDMAEAVAIAAEARRLRDGGMPWSNMAVLFRINAQAEPLQEAFGAAGIPYTLRGVEGFFQRAEVQQAVALLRAAARAATGDERPLPEEVRGILSGMGYTDEPPPGARSARDRWESLRALVAMAEETPRTELAAFVTELAQRAENAHAPVADGVVLVVDPRRTPRRAAQQVVNSLKQARIPILGLVANRTATPDKTHYGRYESGPDFRQGPAEVSG